MPYMLRYQMDVVYVGQGMNAMSVPSAQVKTFFNPNWPLGSVLVPGGETPSAANFNTAISGGMVTDLEAQVLANLTQIQGFATGGN